tara:strand:+ start:432 stop:611 length:180 start_codon:yes stop_codon:yes gene_type:complete
MKVGDLVKWRHHGKLPGIVLETKPLKGAIKGTAVLAYVPECPEPEWFNKSELELIDESR